MMQTMPATIEIFADFTCPWCYISLDRLARLAKERSVRLHWNPYLLRPEIPAEGVPLNSIFSPERFERAEAAVQEAIQAAGLPLNRPAQLPNTHLAHELGFYAEAKGLNDAYHQATMRAYFVQARNIGDSDVLAEIAEELGIAREEALEVMRSGRYRETVGRETEKAFERGIHSVPSFVFESGKNFSGALPYDAFLRAVDETK